MPNEVKVYKKAILEEAGLMQSSNSVIQTHPTLPDVFFIIRKLGEDYAVTVVDKKDIDNIFMNLKSGDNITLSRTDLAYFHKGMKGTPTDQLLVQKLDAQIHFRQNGELFEGQLVTKNSNLSNRKKVIIAAVIGGVVVVAVITAAACIIFTPMGVVAILMAKGLFVFNLAKAHPYIALSALSSVPMIAYKIYKYKTDKKDDKADKADKSDKSDKSDKVEKKDSEAKSDSAKDVPAKTAAAPAP